jgi:hypothetical protein
MMPIAACIALLTLIAGIALFRHGWRGKLIDFHPVCRRCGFDVFGLPRETPHCPECGADLAAPRATHIGHYERLRGPIWAGSMLIAIGILLGGTLTVARVRNIDVQHLKPVWLLVRETRDPATHFAAMNEILRRFSAGQLTQSQIDRIADEELARQANMNQPWLGRSGDLIEFARTAGKLSDDRWKRYVQQALASAVPADAVAVRAQVWRGEPLPVGIHLVPARRGVSGGKRLFVETIVTVSGDPLRSPKPGGATWNLSFDQPLQSAGGIDHHTYLAEMDASKLAAAENGPQNVHITLDTIVSEDPDYFLHAGKTPVLAIKRFDFNQIWNLVPTGTKTVELVRDDRLRGEILEAFRVREVVHYARGQAALALEARNPSVSIAADVLLRVGAKTWKLSAVISPFVVHGSGGPASDLASDRVDVILRPDPALARRTVELARIWGDDIVISDVPVALGTSADVP